MIDIFKSKGCASGLVLAVAPLLVACFSTEAAAYTVPGDLGGISTTGVPAAGYPDFSALSDIKFQKLASGEYRLTATQSSVMRFNVGPDASASYRVSDVNYRLTAYFNSDLEFKPAGSAIDISGKIIGYNGLGDKGYSYSGKYNVANHVGTLFHADLLNYGTDTSPVGLGFTTDASNDYGWASQFMDSNESVWFYSPNVWSAIQNAIANRAGKTWTLTLTNIPTVATVPVPAAVWLLGSALAGFGGFARRRSASVLSA